MSRVDADAPPFFVIHGKNDTLVPVREARLFVRLLRDVSRRPVAYVSHGLSDHGLPHGHALATPATAEFYRLRTRRDAMRSAWVASAPIHSRP